MVLKTKEEARKHLEAAITYIPERYKEGISKADWFNAAVSDLAEKHYAEEISKAIADKRRQKGIKKLSNVDWQKKAIEKGAPVIGERLRGALDEWEANWGAMYDKIVALVPKLPPKTPDWRKNVTERLIKVVEEWRKAAGKSV